MIIIYTHAFFVQGTVYPKALTQNIKWHNYFGS